LIHVKSDAHKLEPVYTGLINSSACCFYLLIPVAMMKTLLILSVIFMTAGCAAKKEPLRADAYQASPPSCSTHNDEIDCQW